MSTADADWADDRVLAGMYRVHGEQCIIRERRIDELTDALTRSQSRVEELEKALRNLLDTIERGDGYRAFERTAAARRALTNSEQGRDSKGDSE